MRRRRLLDIEPGSRTWNAYCAVLGAVAAAWRRCLRHTTVVGVSGSFGKSTAKECVAAALSVRYRVARSRGNQNGRHGVARGLVGVRPSHRYAVLEVGISRPGQMARAAARLRPHVALVTTVGSAHRSSFRTLETAAAEKAQLLAALPAGGLAVLNAADPHVAAMPVPGGVPVVRVNDPGGGFPRVEVVESRWPSRLVLRYVDEDGAVEAPTRLLGDHWAPAVGVAIAAASALGVSPADAAAAIAEVWPSPARMEPVRLPNGADLVRDEYNGSIDSLDAALRFLRAADAGRRIAVLGECDDLPAANRRRMKLVGARAVAACDVAIFIGPHAEYAAGRARRDGMSSDAVHVMETVAELAGFLAADTGPGDLILLKARSNLHLSRAWLAQVGPVECARALCPRRTLCDGCAELHPSRGFPARSPW